MKKLKNLLVSLMTLTMMLSGMVVNGFATEPNLTGAVLYSSSDYILKDKNNSNAIISSSMPTLPSVGDGKYSLLVVGNNSNTANYVQVNYSYTDPTEGSKIQSVIKDNVSQIANNNSIFDVTNQIITIDTDHMVLYNNGMFVITFTDSPSGGSQPGGINNNNLVLDYSNTNYNEIYQDVNNAPALLSPNDNITVESDVINLTLKTKKSSFEYFECPDCGKLNKEVYQTCQDCGATLDEDKLGYKDPTIDVSLNHSASEDSFVIVNNDTQLYELEESEVALDEDEYKISLNDITDECDDKDTYYTYALYIGFANETHLSGLTVSFGNETDELNYQTGYATYFTDNTTPVKVTNDIYDYYGKKMTFESDDFTDGVWEVSLIGTTGNTLASMKTEAIDELTDQNGLLNISKNDCFEADNWEIDDNVSDNIETLLNTQGQVDITYTISQYKDPSNKGLGMLQSFQAQCGIYLSENCKYAYVENIDHNILKVPSGEETTVTVVTHGLSNENVHFEYADTQSNATSDNLTVKSLGNGKYNVTVKAQDCNSYDALDLVSDDYYYCLHATCDANNNITTKCSKYMEAINCKGLNPIPTCTGLFNGSTCGADLEPYNYLNYGIESVERGKDTNTENTDVADVSSASNIINQTIEYLGESNVNNSHYYSKKIKDAITNDYVITSEVREQEISTEDLDANMVSAVNEKKPSGTTALEYIDLSVLVNVAIDEDADSMSYNLTKLNGDITFKTSVADYGNYSNFKVIRYHDGEAEVLPTTYDANTKTITYSTNKFSEYAIVGVKNETTPAATTPVATVTKPTLSKAGDTVVADNGSTVTLLSTGAVSVKMKNVSSKSVTVPTSVTVGGKTYKITTVKGDAFDGTKVTKVTLPKGITKLNAKTFAGDKKLTTIKVNSKKLTIGKNIFKGISKKQKAKIKVTVNKKNMSKKNFYALRKALMKQGIKYRNIKRK